MKKALLITSMTFIMFNLFGQGTKSNIDKEFKKITSKIFPIIKVASSDTETADIELQGENQPIFKKIAGDLLCFYGIDEGSHFQLILKRQLPESITFEHLDKYAHDNLLNFIKSKTQIHTTKFGGLGISCGGNHEAALLTLPELWEIIIGKLGASIIFAVPSKDLIVFVNGNNHADIEGLKAMVVEIHKGGERLLSKQLFSYNNGKIEVQN